MSPSRRLCCLWLALAGCGVTPIELAPAAPSADVMVVGDVPQTAIDALMQTSSSRSDPMRVALDYPLDATALPENVAPVAFAWHAQADAKPAKDAMTAMTAMMSMPKPPMTATSGTATIVSELHLHGPHAELRLYTKDLGATLPAARWRALLRGAADTKLDVELRVRFGTGEIVSAHAIALQLRAPTQDGALYVWSTTAQGIVRAGFDDAHATRVAPARDSARCGGCHALSRDGQRLLLGAGNPAKLDGYTLPAAEERPPAGELASADYGWASFDPTASRVALTSRGQLSVFDADSGARLEQAVLPDGARVTHPDWSPDGRFIAFALLASDGGDDQHVTGSSIARARVALDGTLGAPEVLVAPMAKEDTLVFPSYSPDGTFIAFERAKGDAKEAKEASLFLVAADGGAPIALERSHAMAKGALHPSDSMPTWLPSTRPGSDVLLFSSTRGDGLRDLEPGQEQLLGSVIDGTLAARGMDPSAPPFWLPFQEPGSSYHRGLFAPARLTCAPSLELCNARDDDCDGATDEDCCSPKAERCGDGLDDDCDGSTDEGCDCSFLETCGDGLDGDCDGVVDEDCPSKP